MFKFELPTVRGTDLWPDVMRPPTAVRTVVVVPDGLRGATNVQLAAKAAEILDDSSGYLRAQYNAMRQQVDLGGLDYTKRHQTFPGGTMQYSSNFGQDIVTLTVYPELYHKGRVEFTIELDGATANTITIKFPPYPGVRREPSEGYGEYRVRINDGPFRKPEWMRDGKYVYAYLEKGMYPELQPYKTLTIDAYPVPQGTGDRPLSNRLWLKIYKAKTWRLNYSFKSGSYPAGEINNITASEFDPTDPSYVANPYLANWDANYRAYVLFLNPLPAGEAAYVTTKKTVTLEKRYYVLMGALVIYDPSGPYVYREYQLQAFKRAFSGFSVTGYTEFVTNTEAEEAQLPRKVTEWKATFERNLQENGIDQPYTDFQYEDLVLVE